MSMLVYNIPEKHKVSSITSYRKYDLQHLLNLEQYIHVSFKWSSSEAK